jgi:hypothetical protein
LGQANGLHRQEATGLDPISTSDPTTNTSGRGCVAVFRASRS